MPEEQVVKLKILGFDQDPSTPRASGGSAQFETYINPMKVTHKKAVLFNSNNTNNSTSKDVKQYQGMDQDELEFELTLDNSSIGFVVQDNSKSVEDQVRDLYKVVCDYQGSIHKPYYLVINWAHYGFKGHLKEITVEYDLFEPNGEPVRANVFLKFVGHEDFEAAAKNANNQSPDMTHVKTVLDGDHLPLMCQDVYDNMSHYIQIAEVNNLTNFRQLRMGDPLVFPPLDK